MASAPSNPPQHYKIVRASRATDPAAKWFNGGLVITVQGDEVDAIHLTEKEQTECQLKAQVESKPVESVIRNKKLRKAGAVKFAYLSREYLIPPLPSEESFHSRPTDVVPSQPEAGGSLLGKAFSAAKRRIVGSSSLPLQEAPEQWILDAFKFYNLPQPAPGLSYLATLAKELGADIVSSHQREGQSSIVAVATACATSSQPEGSITLRQADLLASLDETEAYTNNQERLDATVRAALQKKLALLVRLGLISQSTPFGCSFKKSDFPEDILSAIDTSQFIETGSNASVNDGDQDTEDSNTSRLSEHLEKSLTEGVPAVHQEGSFLKLELWPSWYEGPTNTEDSYWFNLVEEQQRIHPLLEEDVILKENLLNFIEEAEPLRKLSITRADILQQLKLEQNLSPLNRVSAAQWHYILTQAAGRKLALALQVGSVEDPIEHFQIEVALNFLLLVEVEYYKSFIPEEPKDVPEQLKDPVAMADLPAVAVSNIDVAAAEIVRIRLRLRENATDPLDHDDIDHYNQIVDTISTTIERDTTIILSTPNITEAQRKLYHEQKIEMVQAVNDFRLQLAKFARKLDPQQQQARRPRGESSRQTRLQLPKVTLPTFKGAWQEWLSYRDVIDTMVINNPDGDLPGIQKFQLLRQSLEGPPLEIIRGIPMTNGNFERAWQALKDRYNNSTRLKARYHKEIANVKPLINPSAGQLRQLFDTLNNAREALHVLGVAGGDEYIISQLISCLDSESRQHYEMRPRPEDADEEDPATWDEIKAFITRRCLALENMRPAAHPTTVAPRKSTAMAAQTRAPPKDYKNRHPMKKWPCPLCAESHGLWACDKFKDSSLDQRRNLAKEKQLCFNCLQPKHSSRDCKSKYTCRECKRKHHTLLHMADRHQPADIQANTATQGFGQVVLPTARVWVEDASKELIPFRALIDTGSQCHFVSEKATQYLRLKRRSTNLQISGIGNGKAPQCKGIVTLNITSITDPTVQLTVKALVLPHVTSDTPSHPLSTDKCAHLQGLQLADPDYGRPGTVDILLGADVALSCFTGRRLLGLAHEPVAHSTSFGWIIGSAAVPSAGVSANLAVTPTIPVTVLDQFWGREAPPEGMQDEFQKQEDKICEEIFVNTTTRLPDGKLQVKFPFKCKPPNVGPSKEIALKRLAGTEARLARNQVLRRQYEEFMNEYESSGHMTEVKYTKDSDVFLPHHPIVRTTALTTKLRVVFDASAKTANGNSINSQQLIGPIVQDDLFSILARFRLHKIAINGDIAKMYRQIWIHPDHQQYQMILWRRKPEAPVTAFKLNTVTYGTASAPWLATRALKWIAEKEAKNHPKAAQIIKESFYVDDLLGGSDSPEEAKQIQQEVTSLLMSYGLPLRKWASNNEWIIKSISGTEEMMTNPEEIVKTLGLKWNSKEDMFHFQVKLKDVSTLTKRSMISEIALTFDPLGFLAPIIVMAKMLYQQVWATKVDWDDPLPEDIAKKYSQLREKLRNLEAIRLPRWVGTISTDNKVELHGFSDASEKAYGAAVYIRVITPTGVVTNLVAAKTRVAPLSTITLPRLELMGALLLAELMQQLVKAYRRPIRQKYYFTDSMITLAWIQAQPSRFKTFVANRIAAIQELSKPEDWRHVGTKENPADLASRGLMPHELRGPTKDMWFKGPNFLRKGELPSSTVVQETQEETKKLQVLHVNVSINPLTDLITRTSSFNRLWRITATILRFIHNCRNKTRIRNAQFSVTEKQEAITKLTAAIQGDEWARELQALQHGSSSDNNIIKQVMKTSKLSNLTPHLDQNGIIRVGGRLDQTTKEFDAKHPAIIPYGRFAKLYLEELHQKTLHAGPTLLNATARQQFWIIRGYQLAREVVKSCITCTTWRGEVMTQQMGQLPTSRTDGVRAFHSTGVDYAGPILLKSRKGRGSTTEKAWICLFICMATKAVHLELVTSLSSEGFIAALRRFIARRGKPHQINSDNGTNFVGADRELKQLLQEQQFQKDLTGLALTEDITWKFIPPSNPHHGGIWESAVKSVKHHLRRVLGEARLTYEEYSTILAQIEAQLNSRPLGPLTEDPTDLEFLTPGHFLIGQPLTAAPDPNLSQLKENRLGRFQYLQRLQQSFWEKWQVEYLSTLQKRNKWQHPQEDIKINQLVLIKEDNTAPTQWRRGRVIELHPGKDNKVRVVKLRTSQGEVTRPIVKLIPLFYTNVSTR